MDLKPDIKKSIDIVDGINGNPVFCIPTVSFTVFTVDFDDNMVIVVYYLTVSNCS